MADLEAADASPEGRNRTARLLARHERRRDPVLPGALVDVDEVHAHRVDFHEHLPGAGSRLRHVQVFEGVGAAGRFDLNGFHDTEQHRLVTGGSARLYP